MKDLGPEPVQVLTTMMRDHDGPFWRGIRRELRNRGISPEQTSLADGWQAAAGDSTFIACSGGRVVQWTYRYADESPGNGSIVDWQDISATYESCDHFHAVEHAKRLLESAQPP